MTDNLRLDEVKVWFGGVHAVDGVSLSLEAGRLYGVVGPNGSGKTTLINAITGLTRLTAGSIHFGGGDITGQRPHRISQAGIARTFQLIKLLPSFSVLDNVLLTAERHATSGESAHELAGAMIERLGLTDVADQATERLPYGTQRRVEIARALASRPKLLLLDEPIAGMNQRERVEIAEVISQLRHEGLTVMLVEHDLRTLLRICDELVVMNFGKLIAAGAPRDTAALPEVRAAYLGQSHAVA